MTTPFYAGSTATAAAVDAALPQNYVLATNQTINTTSDDLIGNFVSTELPIGTYKITVDLNYVANQSAGTPSFAFHGPAAPSLQAITANINGGGSNQPVQVAGGGGFASVAMANGEYYNVDLVYTVTTTTAGTISFQAHTSAGADTFTIAAGAVMTVTAASLS